MNNENVKFFNATATQSTLEQRESDWEYQLDLLGTNASLDEYRKHLAIAPNPQSEMAIYLMTFLSECELQKAA